MLGNLDKAPLDPTPSPSKLYKKTGHPGTADILYSFEGGPSPPPKCIKLPVREDPI